MNHHELLDLATVWVSALAIREKKFFARSLDSPPIGEVVSESTAALDGFATHGEHGVAVNTPVDEFDCGYLVWRWYGDDVPTLIFHHGSGEDPFDFGRFSSNSVRRLFANDDWADRVNLIAVRAPFHDRSNMAYATSMGQLADFIGMCAASTALVDVLVEHLKDRGSPVAVSGISLGGWVANLHRAFFETADQYVPIFAGSALGEMFATSVYQRMTGKRARQRPAQLRSLLDFSEAFADNPTNNCLPLLARYDRIIDYEAQRGCYEGLPLAVIDKGHVTGSLATGAMRDRIRRALDRTVD